ncbi:MAG: S8 family peptidase [Candidatus Promineifilaceae bacterium]|jgi:subtilisin family serine protease
MYKPTYTILRSESLAPPAIGNLGGALESTTPQEVRIEETQLELTDRNDLRRDPRTRAIAITMPMKLIEPVAKADAAPAAANTWGIEAVNAHNSPFDGSGITVAVLDTGIDLTHPAFAGVDIVRKNFTTEADDDLHGHGTHCAGTIFGQDINGTRIGIARNVQHALIGKVLGQGGGSSTSISQAINWAIDSGANVISMSLGIDFPGFVDYLVNQQGLPIPAATSIALEGYRSNINLFTELSRFVAANNAFGPGTVIMAASGNESERPEYEIAVAPPAASTGMIAVGALGQSSTGLTVASFSNNQVDVSAPGVGVVSARLGGGLVSMSGTSMATPHTAGIAALWAQRQLDMTGNINQLTLLAQVIASGTMVPLAPGSEAEDVGTGIVQAPL